MLKDKTLTYISLFSSAGVGCYGFHMEGYKCIATNEIIERRLKVQRANGKCDFDSGYIVGDITTDETKERIYQEIDRWRKLGNDKVDVVVATPPCQGISVINHKKTDGEIHRNSLVVQSVDIVMQIRPRFFIFENVMAFGIMSLPALRTIKSARLLITLGVLRKVEPRGFIPLPSVSIAAEQSQFVTAM